jgi:hypothetical protein
MNMKKVFFILSLVLLTVSCVSEKSMVVFNENGECFPTIENIDQMYKKRIETGLKYVWFNCEWVTRAQRDSLSDIENDRIFEELILLYDSIPN